MGALGALSIVRRLRVYSSKSLPFKKSTRQKASPPKSLRHLAFARRGYQRLPQFPPQLLRHPPRPRTSLMTSNSSNAPMVALMTAETMPEPR
jgi:hypothetical protein